MAALAVVGGNAYGLLVDTYTASVYPVPWNNVILTSQSFHDSPAITEHDRSHDPSLKEDRGSHDPSITEHNGSHDPSIFLSPVTLHDSYNIEFKVQPDGPAIVRVVDGVCCVNGVRCDSGDRRMAVGNGSFIELGSSYRLQYQATPTKESHPYRVLPPTPGSSVYEAPPTKPTRQTFDECTSSNSVSETDGGDLTSSEITFNVGLSPRTCTMSSYTGSIDLSPIKDDLRSRLKRIAKEITARDDGYKDRRPPPPYEQVANSINYQLLHQNHSEVSPQLIDALYSTLKTMEMKDSSLPDVYSSLLSSYSAARAKSATPTCMLPADLPVVQFVMEMILHLCCMPDVIPLASKHCPLWMNILAILCTSNQNQRLMVEKRYATSVLSCMHLSLMSDSVDFQEHGWTILYHIVDHPTEQGAKPVIIEASLSLALSLMEQQLSSHSSQLTLVTAILHTLTRIATVAREAVDKNVSENVGDDTYTFEQGTQVISLLQEGNVLTHLMKVPPHIRSSSPFYDHYCSLVKALLTVKTRKTDVAKKQTTPTKPPRKPARKLRRSTIGSTVEGRRSKDDELTTPTEGHMTSDLEFSQSDLIPFVRRPHRKTGLRPHSYTVTPSNLIGSSDHVTEQAELMKNDDGNHSNQEITKDPSDNGECDHVMSGDNHVTCEDQLTQTTETVEICDERSEVADVEATESPVAIVMSLIDDQSNPFTFHRSDTLSRDVQSLLESLRAPLPPGVCEGGRRVTPLHVPHNSHYFRHSVKRRGAGSRKGVGGVCEPLAGILVEEDNIKTVPLVQSPTRMQWGNSPPPILPDSCSLFEVSGEILSPSHTLLEEISSGHTDVMATLRERTELLEGVLNLWSKDKGLQAVTNTLQGCFSDGSSDLPLFIDILNCLQRHESPWTLAVCCVLLPALRQVLSTQRDKSCVLTVVRLLMYLVERFSDLILACKAPTRSRSRRLSVSIDRQQQVACYRELHSTRVAIGNRLNMNFDPKDITTKLRKVYSVLKPYKHELSE